MIVPSQRLSDESDLMMLPTRESESHDVTRRNENDANSPCTPQKANTTSMNMKSCFAKSRPVTSDDLGHVALVETLN